MVLIYGYNVFRLYTGYADGGMVRSMLNRCCRDSSVSCPYRACIARGIEECNFKSGRFTERLSKPSVVPIFNKHVCGGA